MNRKPTPDEDPLHYMEGKIVAIQPRFTLIEWHDGARERIDSKTDMPLKNLQRGDSFGAWVKVGKDIKTLKLENIVPLQITNH